MSNKFFKSFFALALVVGSALGFVACEDLQQEVTNPTVEVSVKSLTFSNEEEAQSVEITANGDWKVTVDYLTGEDWIIVTPMAGNGNTTISVAVPMNNSGAIREATIKVIALHPVYGNWDVKKIKVAQSSTETPPVAEALLYGDNFDGKKATKEYGSSNNSWPYIDQFPEFANAEGPASENVTYSGSGVSVRANSESNGGYSDYTGSGANNIFFGGGAYFQINTIALDASQLSYKMTFGSEKYTQDGDSTFKNEEFLLYISKDGLAWAPVEYTFAGTEPGRWNVATANFTLAAGTEVLYVKFEAKVASVYRLDDVKLFTGNGGQTIDLDNIEEPTPVPPSTEALYYENFDGKGATKDGNGYWPYVDQLPEMKNAVGPAAANVSYEGHNTTVRNNSNSDGTYSDYAGSGVNNIFFGKGNAWFMVKELALESSQKDLVLTFGTEKYSQSLGSLFTPSEFIVTISGDGEKWSNVDYTFAGTAEGRWNVATANFTLKEVPAKLYIKFMATAESAYRLDDVTLNVGEGGTEIDLGAGTTGGDNGGQNPTPDTDAYYFDNFDGKEATKTYGSGSSWPYIDQFPEFANAVGSAAGSVTYTGKAVSVRNNSNSNGTYSDYAGSGLNNIFFGADAYFQVSGIALASDQKNLKLTFGTEKYSQDNGSKFTPSEFHVLLSADGEKWSEISYTFAGTAEGRWNVATANFTLKEVPASLHIKFVVDVASSYRIDDLSLAAGEGGQSVDLANGSENPGGGEEPENPEQPEGPDQPVVPGDGEFESDSIFVCSVDDSTNAVYSLGTTAINGESVTGFKLGKSKQAGKFTSGAVGVDGTKYLNFYAQGWKGGDVTLYFRVDGGATQSQKLASHDGVTGNPPYTALSFDNTDHYSFKLEGLTASSKIEFSTDANFALTSADSTMPSARAIVCGVKLTDAPLNGGEGGSDDNEDNGDNNDGNEGGSDDDDDAVIETLTIADVLALGQGATIDGAIECVVISDCTIENLTSKKGMYVQDDTAALQLRLAADHEFAFGTKVKIDLTGCKLGEYGGAVQVDGIALDKVTTISTGNSVVAKTVSIADFLANKYEGQYIAIEGVQVADSDLARTWVEGEKHTSINIEDAQGNKFIVFSSKYATYGAQQVAQGSGTIKGISSINNGKMQIIFAQVSDFAGLTGARFGADNDDNEGGNDSGDNNDGGNDSGDNNDGGNDSGDNNEGENGSGDNNNEGEVATSVVFDIASYTFDNQEALTSYTVDPITFAFDAGSNSYSNAPKYYVSGAAVRCYSGNTITITGKTITSVEVVTVDKTDLALYDGDTKLDNFTWTGSSDNVVLTFDPTTAKGQTRFTSIKVTYAE